jgi:hypothetical protein
MQSEGGAGGRILRAGPALALGLALAIGASLMFVRLGTDQLSGDESLTWAAASAPTVADVVRIQHQVNSGKLAFHELLLREWMSVFGESETAMRSLSAIFGLVSLLLVFFLTNELLSAPPGDRAGARMDRPDPQAVAALATLICALSIPLLKVSREARMYSMMLALMLAQMYFLLRAWRRGGAANYAALSVFTAGAVAANFTALLALLCEGLWLVWLRIRPQPGGAPPDAIGPWKLAGAVGLGFALLLPFSSGLVNGVTGVERGDFRWIAAPLRWEPIATFESAIGTLVFPLLTLLAIAGAIAWWKRRARRDGFVFAMLVLWMPPIVLMAGTWLVMPMLVTRYIVVSFVPLYILAAIGIASMNSNAMYASALAATLVLSGARAINYLRVPRNDQIRQACAAALAMTGPHGRIGTVRDYYLVRYYMPPDRRSDVVQLTRRGNFDRFSDVPVVILGSHARPNDLALFEHFYPHLVGRFPHRVTVLSRVAPFAVQVPVLSPRSLGAPHMPPPPLPGTTAPGRRSGDPYPGGRRTEAAPDRGTLI